MSQGKKREHGALYSTLFLDVFFDPRTRPIFIYATVVIGIGTVVYHWLEGWSMLDSLYFVVVTLTTIGYGDFTPSKPITKLITIFYGINGILLLLLLFDAIRTLRGWQIKSPAVNADDGDKG